MSAQEAPLKHISRDEVSKHNTMDSAWIIIENKVYDIRKFIKEHPCGMAVLTKYAGKDSTKEFRFMDGGHSPGAYAQKEFYLIGEVNEDEKVEYQFDENECSNLKSGVVNKDGQCTAQNSEQQASECPFVQAQTTNGAQDACPFAQ